jgi:hypothetical protein
MTAWLGDDEMRAWQAFLRAGARLLERLDRLVESGFVARRNCPTGRRLS